MISGTTALIAHFGHPTASFKAPMIYNPYFESAGIDAVVVPTGVVPRDYASVVEAMFKLTNIRGALVTMPHKIATAALMDELSTAASIAGSCNAILRRPDGSLLGDMFDGEGFVRGMSRKGRAIAGARVLVVGAGGVGSAIAASLAGAGASEIRLHDRNIAAAEALALRLRAHHPRLLAKVAGDDPDGCDIVVNASPLGMRIDDPLPMDVSRIAPTAFAGEVVMAQELTPFLQAARARGCEIQIGADMLFEQIPVYLEFFGFPTTTPENLRTLAKIGY